VYERLHPAGPPVSAAQMLAEARLGEGAPEGRPYLFANFVTTVDGRATLGGNTRGLGGPADLEMLLELRGVADAVLVGSGTVRVEGYGRLVNDADRRARRAAAGLAPDPAAVVISRGLDLPWDAGLFAAPDQPVIVYTGSAAGAPEVAAPVEIVRLADCTAVAALTDLRRRGVRALLCEGGPRLFRALLGDGLVDELFLTLAPLLTADPGERGLLPGPSLPEPAKLTLTWALSAGPELFLRYVVANAADRIASTSE
jgi:riboflavin biosynthesis pyrimidine reductase